LLLLLAIRIIHFPINVLAMPCKFGEADAGGRNFFKLDPRGATGPWPIIILISQTQTYWQGTCQWAKIRALAKVKYHTHTPFFLQTRFL